MRRLTAELVASTLAFCSLLPSSAWGQAERERSDTSPGSLGLEAPDKNLPVGAEDLPPPSAGELLAERARALDAREAELEQAAKDLALAEKRVEDKLAKLEQLLERKEGVEKKILSQREKEEEERLERIIEVTSKMPPDRAASYLMEMPIAISAKIIEGMKTRKAAAIMAALPASRAAEIGRKYLRSGKSSRQPNLNSRDNLSGESASPSQDEGR